MSSGPHRILFLYSELAGYIHACLNELARHSQVEAVQVIHWPVNAEAPFQFPSNSEAKFLKKVHRNRSWLKTQVQNFQPSAIVTSGWMDSDYNAIAREWRSEIPVILTFDNWWHGSIKQQLALCFFPVFVQRHFSKAWVPGAPQIRYAKKLGFTGNSVISGYYCADYSQFEQLYRARRIARRKKKKRLLFVGRYVEVKGLSELWSAFLELSQNYPEWELHCVGTGGLWESRPSHPSIIHHGFKQPQELAEIIKHVDAFILPSTFEPWGVVIHEMAICGLPILCSDRVGSSTEFLLPSRNGFEFKPNKESLALALQNLYGLSDEELDSFGEMSRTLGVKRTPKHWVNTLIDQLSN